MGDPLNLSINVNPMGKKDSVRSRTTAFILIKTSKSAIQQGVPSIKVRSIKNGSKQTWSAAVTLAKKHKRIYQNELQHSRDPSLILSNIYIYI